jgi:hypothetical protein
VVAVRPLARAAGARAMRVGEAPVVVDGTLAKVFAEDVLNRVYHMDVRDWMTQMLAQWKET